MDFWAVESSFAKSSGRLSGSTSQHWLSDASATAGSPPSCTVTSQLLGAADTLACWHSILPEFLFLPVFSSGGPNNIMGCGASLAQKPSIQQKILVAASSGDSHHHEVPCTCRFHSLRPFYNSSVHYFSSENLENLQILC